jgi:outer membrane lipoprotein-sorting protein
MPRRSLRIVIFFVLTAVATAGVSAVELEALLVDFDRVQESIQTLSAEFTETTQSTLLKDHVVAEGKLFLTKPDSVRWEYTVPEEMRFVIANDEYTGYFPLRKQAEKRDVRRWGEHLFRFLGLGQASDELGKFYTISMAEENPDGGSTVLLVLSPKKKRVRKRMESVSLWIDGETFLPVRVRYSSKNGDIRTVEFAGVTVNPVLATSLYEVDLPADVEVTTGFSALSSLSSSSTP